MSIHLRKQRGAALIAVLGITAALIVYLISVQGAMEITHRQARLATRRQAAAEDLAALVTLALASSQAASGGEPLKLPGGGQGRFTREALPAGHAFWRTAPHLRPLAGDELLTVDLTAPTPDARQARFLVNRLGARPGLVTLEAAAPIHP